MRKNNAEEYESIEIYLSETQHPIAFNTKVNELIESGLSAEEAKKFVRETPFEMELYYSPSQGLFMVESEAVECADIYNPYSGELLEEAKPFI